MFNDMHSYSPILQKQLLCPTAFYENARVLSAIPPKSSRFCTPFTSLTPRSTHFKCESTDAMRIKCLAQGHNIQMPGFEPSTFVSRTDILTTYPICSNTSIAAKHTYNYKSQTGL